MKNVIHMKYIQPAKMLLLQMVCYSVNHIVCAFFDCGTIPTTEDVKNAYKALYGTPCALFTEEIDQIINAVRVYDEKEKAILNK